MVLGFLASRTYGLAIIQTLRNGWLPQHFLGSSSIFFSLPIYYWKKGIYTIFAGLFVE